MKNELGITKGEWIISDLIQDDGMYVYSTRNRLSAILRIYKGENPNAEQAESNAKLIAEAGTVANETGKTPRQLADDNKVLLEALKEMIRTVNPTDVTPNKVSMGVSLGEYYVGGCSFPSNKSIHMAINAIKQVTE